MMYGNMCAMERERIKRPLMWVRQTIFAVAFVLLSPNPFPNPKLEPFRIAMVRDAPYTKDDDTHGQYSRHSSARVA